MKTFNVQQGSFNVKMNGKGWNPTKGFWFLTSDGTADPCSPVIATVKGEDDVPDLFIRAAGGVSGNPRDDARLLATARGMYDRLEWICRNCACRCVERNSACKTCETGNVLKYARGET